MKFTSEKAFTLVELLITIAIVVVLASMGMATFSLYQKRAYNTTALQIGIQLRKAFDAGLATRASTGSTVYDENRSIIYDIDGNMRCLAGCNGIDLNEIFPGFVAQPGVKLIMLISTLPSFTIQAGHCKALTDDGNHYDGWIISDQSASIRAAIPVDPAEVAQCTNVLGGNNLGATPTPAPSASPTPPPVVDCSAPGSCAGSLCAYQTNIMNPDNFCPCVESNGSCVENCGASGCSCPQGAPVSCSTQCPSGSFFSNNDCTCEYGPDNCNVINPVNCTGCGGCVQQSCPTNVSEYCTSSVVNDACVYDCSACPTPTPTSPPTPTPTPVNNCMGCDPGQCYDCISNNCTWRCSPGEHCYGGVCFPDGTIH